MYRIEAVLAANDPAPGPEELQDLLLKSPGFTEFLLSLSTISASLFSTDGSVHCAITVERNGGPTTVASSSTTAQRLDEQQYAFDDGPCLTALRGQHTVLIPDLGGDQRWRRYAQAVTGEGIGAVLAVPIPTDSTAKAALNCYAPDTTVFTVNMVASIEKHAVSLSRILRLALRVHPADHYPDDLRAVMKSRAVVDAAIALVMVQNRLSREAAMTLLQVASRHHDTKIQDIADELLRKSTAATVVSRTAEDG
ncbi:GAF and ANTAR domain-containing protein [Arthrobacter subterraneus]|uniref:GAF and ANTAR domain-containing protein n=1 Tax=Arthrobacter subterraneus TaxID=335973 RepID=UPI001FE135B4|nr:GAF and ANTAR domain-containing protein [Arthrobacter subterraneus]